MRLLDLATAALASALAAAAPSASAFQILRPPASHRFNRGSDPAIFAVESRHRSPALLVPSRLSASADNDDDSDETGVSIPSDTVSAAKSRVLTLARRLSPLGEGVGGGDSRTGVFVTDPDQRRELRKAVAELEAVCGVTGERERQLMVGDWTLLCTTNTPSGRPGGLSSAEKSDSKRKKKKGGLPFKLPENNPAREVQERIRDKVRKSIEVTQRIRTSDDDDDDDDGEAKISRVDNIVEFSPPFETLSDILTENSPLNALKDLKLNPLEVKKSKVTLIHDANVESTTPVLRTKIGLKSVVLTVAGTSQYLEPDGADILGLNVPLGEFLNAGYFDTTYVDENLRISRGSVGPALDVLRVFVRRGMYVEPIENAEADLVDNAAAPDEAEAGEEKTELQSSAEKLRDAVEGAVQDVVDTLNDDLEKVRDSVEAVGNAVEDAAEDLAVAVSDGVVEVQKAAGEVRDAARGRAKETAEEVRDGVEDAVRELEDQAEEAVAAAVGREDARKMRESVDGAVEDVAEGVKNVTEAVRGAAEDVVDAAEGGVEKVREAAEDATKAVSEDVGEVVKAAEDVAEDVAEAVRSEAKEEEGDGETEEEGADKEEDEEKK